MCSFSLPIPARQAAPSVIVASCLHGREREQRSPSRDPKTHLTTLLFIRAARLQNEVAPEKFWIDTKKSLKNAKKDPKNDPKRVWTNLSLSQAASKDFTGTFLKVFHCPKLAQQKKRYFSPRGSAGVATLTIYKRSFNRESLKGWPKTGVQCERFDRTLSVVLKSVSLGFYRFFFAAKSGSIEPY